MLRYIVLLFSIFIAAYEAEAYDQNYNYNRRKYRPKHYYKKHYIDKNIFILGELSTSPQIRVSNQSLITNSKELKSSLPNFNIAVGKHINNIFYTSISFGYREFSYNNENTYPNGEISNTTQNSKLYSLMFNNYLNTNIINDFMSAYLLLGVGFAQMKPGNVTTVNLIHAVPVQDTTLSKHSTNFTYQAGVGTIIQATKNIGVDTSIRYVSYGKMKFIAADSMALKAVEVAIGLKVDIP